MTENPFQLPGYQVIGMQDTGVAFDVHLQPPSPVACSSCGTIGDFVKNGTRDIRVMDLPVHGKPVTLWVDGSVRISVSGEVIPESVRNFVSMG